MNYNELDRYETSSRLNVFLSIDTKRPQPQTTHRDTEKEAATAADDGAVVGGWWVRQVKVQHEFRRSIQQSNRWYSGLYYYDWAFLWVGSQHSQVYFTSYEDQDDSGQRNVCKSMNCLLRLARAFLHSWVYERSHKLSISRTFWNKIGVNVVLHSIELIYRILFCVPFLLFIKPVFFLLDLQNCNAINFILIFNLNFFCINLESDY